MSDEPPQPGSTPTHTAERAPDCSLASDAVPVEVEIEFSGDLRPRVRLKGPPEKVLKVVPAAVQLMRDAMKEVERTRIRKRFVAAAHVVVFGLAALSIIGLALDFANVRDFNTAALFTMGGWVLGSIVYFYLAIVRDAFGLKVAVPKPPSLPSIGPD